METILITNGHVVDPSQKLDKKADVLIKDGKIQQIAEKINKNANKVVEAKGKIVTPGLIDMHVHLREPGREDKETIKTASKAAAQGGFTTIVGMPNTNPPADNQTTIGYVKSKAQKEALVNIQVVGNMTKCGKGDKIAEIGDLKNAGAIALSDDGADILNTSVARHAFEYAAMLNMPIISHSEDTKLAGNWSMNEGYMSTKLGLPGKPAAAEEIAIARNVELAKLTKAKLHVTHLNTEKAAMLVSEAKNQGLEITCDTCPHYFTLDESYLENYDPQFKMNPPLRDKSQVQAILKRLSDGSIDVIASDHAPHLLVDKDLEFENCANGIVGLETSLGLVLTFLVDKKVISIERMVELMSFNPAKILGLKSKGTLRKGADADLTIIDIKKKWIVDKDKFKSKGRNTPFHGWKMKGKATHVVVAGNLVD